MRQIGRPHHSLPVRSPGIACLAFDGVLDDGRKVRRSFVRAARGVRLEAVIVDVRNARAISSAAWAAIVGSVRTLAQNGAAVTLRADTRLRHLLELSGLAGVARVVLTSQAA